MNILFLLTAWNITNCLSHGWCTIILVQFNWILFSCLKTQCTIWWWSNQNEHSKISKISCESWHMAISDRSRQSRTWFCMCRKQILGGCTLIDEQWKEGSSNFILHFSKFLKFLQWKRSTRVNTDLIIRWVECEHKW